MTMAELLENVTIVVKGILEWVTIIASLDIPILNLDFGWVVLAITITGYLIRLIKRA